MNQIALGAQGRRFLPEGGQRGLLNPPRWAMHSLFPCWDAHTAEEKFLDAFDHLSVERQRPCFLLPGRTVPSCAPPT